ncbi:unnamed protein product [Rotaria sordida]|uniref:CTF/NF-I domain-containing protein n=1 Tax=Rotaria sordida TaxID=392033 RepID=A0A814XA06_9BILA|nr:unnamed protein product [Rotaria sordida]CAF3674752.1 unnamed protein product [Rotaria sordida]
MSHLEGSECIEALIPFVKSFAFTWFNLQAAKRRYQKQHETPMPIEMERVMKEDFMNQRYADKIKWTVRILAKLRKDIKRECRGDLVKTITEGNIQSPCIISNADTKNKMRRIDCLRQADKVWRLDVVMVVLFRGIPLESTDGERLSKCKECKNPALCINPYHVVIHVKELEVYLVNFINNTQSSPANIIPSVFSTSELQHMANSSISEGGSTKEVLGADYLGSMLKMETDDYNETQPISTAQQPDLLKMCRNRKPSLSGSPRTAKRRRTLNNTCSADESDSHDVNDGPVSTYDVYEPKTNTDSSSSTCRISSTNDSNTYSNFQQQDDINTLPKSIIESNKIEPSTPRPPFSQIGIHNHVSLNLHFNNQQQQHQQHQQPQQQQQQQSQKPLSSSSTTSQQTSDSKLISERFIESLVQRFNNTQQHQRTTSSHPHTIEYFHQDSQTERTSNSPKTPSSSSSSSNKLFPKPLTTTAINILSSRERPITTTTTTTSSSSSNYDTSYVQSQTNEFKDNKTNSNNDNNVVRLSSAADRVLPAFHTFAELKSYLQTIGLDVELVPASNTTTTTTTTTNIHQQSRNVDPIQQRLSTNEQQYQIHSNTVNISQTPPQPQIVMLPNNINNRNSLNDDGKCNRSTSISVPPNILAEKLLEYTSNTSSVRHSNLSSRPSPLSSQQQQQQQQRRSPSKPPIVSDIANLLSVSNNNNNNNSKDQPIVQQVTRQTLLPPPPPPPPPSSSTPTTTVYHRITSADKVSTMVKRDLIHDDVHLHDREVEEYMNMTPTGRTSKQRKTNSQTINDSTTKSIVLESGSASNSNDSNVSSTSSSSSSINNSTNINNNNNNHNHTNNINTNNNNNNNNNNNIGLTNSINKTKNNSTMSNQDSRNICDLLLMLYEQERTRSTQLQKQIEQVSRQQRSRNSSGQSHSSESQTGLETPQGTNNGNTNSSRMLSPAAWISTTGKEKTLVHIQQNHHQTLKFDSSTSINGSPPESQDCSPPDPNKSGLSPTKVVQFSQSIGSAQNLIPRPVPMLATNDGLVRHTSSSSSSHTATPTGSTSSSNNGVLYTPGNRIFQSPLGQAFAALSPALSPFLSPSTSRAGTPSELMIIPADLLNVLNSRIWSEDELLQAFVNHLDSGAGSGRRSRVNNEEPKQQGKPTSVTNNNNNNNNNNNGNGKTKSIEK